MPTYLPTYNTIQYKYPYMPAVCGFSKLFVYADLEGGRESAVNRGCRADSEQHVCWSYVGHERCNEAQCSDKKFASVLVSHMGFNACDRATTEGNHVFGASTPYRRKALKAGAESADSLSPSQGTWF